MTRYATRSRARLPAGGRWFPVWLAALLVVPLGMAAEALAQQPERAKLLRVWARSYYPGRSGDLLLVPEEGRFVTVEGLSFMHGSPWDYDARIPIVLYGPGHVKPGVYEAAAGHREIGATLEALLGLPRAPTTTGRVLDEALEARDEDEEEDEAGPRAIVLLVLDGFGLDYLERYPEETPNLRLLTQRGAWFPNARVDVLPTATSVSHATLVTGAEPALHGITGNLPYDRGRGEAANAFEGATADNLIVPTLTERWAAWTHGRAVVVAQGGTYYPAAALAGRGGCGFGGLRVVMAYFDGRSGGWNSNQDCYRFPGYLIDQNIQILLVEAAEAEEEPADASANHRFAEALPRFEGDATAEILQMEPFGEDAVTDLLFVNHKATDRIGHAYGPGSEQLRWVVAEVDRQVARLLELLEERVGAGSYVFMVTADHGMPEEPDTEGRGSRDAVVSQVNGRFDPDGTGIVLHYDPADNQVYLDRARLEELELGSAEVAAFIEELPFFRFAFTEHEVRRAVAALQRGAEPPAAEGGASSEAGEKRNESAAPGGTS